MLTLFPHFPLSRWTRSDPPPMELLMLSRTQVLPAPGILGEQVGFSWSNRPCMPVASCSFLKGSHSTRPSPEWRPGHGILTPNRQSSKHSNFTMVCDHVHPVGPSPGGYSDCLLLNSELYGDDLYAMNHDEFTHLYPSYNDLNQHEHKREIHFCQPSLRFQVLDYMCPEKPQICFLLFVHNVVWCGIGSSFLPATVE